MPGTRATAREGHMNAGSTSNSERGTYECWEHEQQRAARKERARFFGSYLSFHRHYSRRSIFHTGVRVRIFNVTNTNFRTGVRVRIFSFTDTNFRASMRVLAFNFTDTNFRACLIVLAVNFSDPKPSKAFEENAGRQLTNK